MLGEVRGGNKKYYNSDSLGSTRTVADNAGTVSATRETDAFGNVWSPGTMGTMATPFGFAGQHGYQTDTDSGLMRLGHRYYGSSTGRLLSRDPIQDGSNWYSYCANDPINAVDPTGLKPPPWADGQGFPNIDAAAKAALMYIYAKSNREGIEYGGTIIDMGEDLKEKRYRVSEPITDGLSTHVDIPINSIDVAMWHTHPVLPFHLTDEFSVADKNAVSGKTNKRHIPLYLGTPKLTKVYEMNPDDPGNYRERGVK